VWNWGSTLGSVLDASYQGLWIEEYVRDRQDAQLIQIMRELTESHKAYSQCIVFSISCILCSWLLFLQSPVDCSFGGDDLSAWGFIVIQTFGMLWIDISSTSTLSLSFEWSSKLQSLGICTVELPNHLLEGYPILFAWIVIELAENSDGICCIGPSGSDHINTASYYGLVYDRIRSFFLQLYLGKHHH